MYTFKQIIENQERYRSEIIKFFTNDFFKIKKDLFLIKSKDEFFINEKKKINQKLKDTKFKTHLNNLFFRSKNRNRTYYVWWDIENEEGKILTYEKK